MDERATKSREVDLSLARFSFAFRAKKGMTSFPSPALDGAIRQKQSNMFVSTKSIEEIC